MQYRDISQDTLTVKVTNLSVGVLIELDIADRVKKGGSPLAGKTLPPAGTLQFCAFELIAEIVQGRLYQNLPRGLAEIALGAEPRLITSPKHSRLLVT